MLLSEFLLHFYFSAAKVYVLALASACTLLQNVIEYILYVTYNRINIYNRCLYVGWIHKYEGPICEQRIHSYESNSIMYWSSLMSTHIKCSTSSAPCTLQLLLTTKCIKFITNNRNKIIYNVFHFELSSLQHHDTEFTRAFF